MPKQGNATATTIVFTGKRSRFLALKKEFAQTPNLNLVGLSLLRTVPSLSPSDWERLKDTIQKSDRLLLAVFSINGIETLHGLLASRNGFIHTMTKDLADLKLVSEKIKKAKWAVPSHRTALALEKYFGVLADFLSPDETGGGLAQLLLQRKLEWQTSTLVALSAKRGREEFYTILQDAGVAIDRFGIYTSRICVPKPEELCAIPKKAWIILGSPQIAETFFSNPEFLKPSWRYACLGKTTLAWLTNHGIQRPHVSTTADYTVLVHELLA